MMKRTSVLSVVLIVFAVACTPTGPPPGTTVAMVSVASSSPVSVFGQPVTLVATVSGPPGSGSPTGLVTFFDGLMVLGTGSLDSSGAATLDPSTIAVGIHSITTVYGGDLNFAPVTSSSLVQTVLRAASNPVVTSSVNPSPFGQTVTFTVTVAAVAPGAGTPAGSVMFFDGGIGNGVFIPLDSSGSATFATTLAVGQHSIQAAYGGSPSFNSSTSFPLTQTVQ